MTYCEDAPCCGCCGTNLYGVRQDSSYDEPDYDDYYEREPDPKCGEYDYDDEEDGVPWCYGCDDYCHAYEVDGAPVNQWEVTTPNEVYMTDQGYEDRAMESALLGDC